MPTFQPTTIVPTTLMATTVLPTTVPNNGEGIHHDVNDGFCTSVTRKECEAIARNRNVRLVEIRNPNKLLFPRGCYHKTTNNKIYYNVVKSTKPCS